MKQLKITDQCTGCGLCVVQSQYLEEDEEGNARCIPGKRILEEDLEEIERLMQQCPEQAIVLTEKSLTQKKGKGGLEDLAKEIQKMIDTYKAPEVKAKDMEFCPKDYSLNFPLSYNHDSFSSKGTAESFAKNEFRRICYSSETHEAALRKVFIKYKLDKLKPYYTVTDSEESFYKKYNEDIEKKLKDIYAEAKELSDGTIPLDVSWTDFEVYPDWGDIKYLEEFDANTIPSSMVVDELKSDGEFTRMQWYLDKLDYNCQEEYVGDGLFGRLKFAKRWYVWGINDAMFEFKADLGRAMVRRSGEISEYAMQFIGYALSGYEREVKAALREKMREFQRCK